MKVVTAEQMRQIDHIAADIGLTTEILMENAGRAVTDGTKKLLGGVIGKHILILTGPGNNGGDGLVEEGRPLRRRRAVRAGAAEYARAIRLGGYTASGDVQERGRRRLRRHRMDRGAEVVQRACWHVGTVRARRGSDERLVVQFPALDGSDHQRNRRQRLPALVLPQRRSAGLLRMAGPAEHEGDRLAPADRLSIQYG